MIQFFCLELNTILYSLKEYYNSTGSLPVHCKKASCMNCYFLMMNAALNNYLNLHHQQHKYLQRSADVNNKHYYLHWQYVNLIQHLYDHLNKFFRLNMNLPGFRLIFPI